jgi:hypothetical protein
VSGYSDEYGAWEWLRAHRVEFGPAYLGVPVLGLGVGAHFLTLTQFWLLEAALAIGFGFWIRSARGWRRPYYGSVGPRASRSGSPSCAATPWRT